MTEIENIFVNRKQSSSSMNNLSVSESIEQLSKKRSKSIEKLSKKLNLIMKKQIIYLIEKLFQNL